VCFLGLRTCESIWFGVQVWCFGCILVYGRYGGFFGFGVFRFFGLCVFVGSSILADLELFDCVLVFLVGVVLVTGCLVGLWCIEV